MEWVIKIENKPTNRILVKFNPELNLLEFYGQKKIKLSWETFSSKTINIETNLEEIKDTLFKVYEVMKNKIIYYDDISDSFSLIKTIEIVDEKKEQN